MKSILLQPTTQEHLDELIKLADKLEIRYFFVSEEAGKKLAALELSQLAQKKPTCICNR